MDQRKDILPKFVQAYKFLVRKKFKHDQMYR